jgi:hypothetical protein
MTNPNPKRLFRPLARLRAFFDFLILFSGISTPSNLARTQQRPLKSRGIFLFRSKKP